MVLCLLRLRGAKSLSIPANLNIKGAGNAPQFYNRRSKRKMWHTLYESKDAKEEWNRISQAEALVLIEHL